MATAGHPPAQAPSSPDPQPRHCGALPASEQMQSVLASVEEHEVLVANRLRALREVAAADKNLRAQVEASTHLLRTARVAHLEATERSVHLDKLLEQVTQRLETEEVLQRQFADMLLQHARRRSDLESSVEDQAFRLREQKARHARFLSRRISEARSLYGGSVADGDCASTDAASTAAKREKGEQLLKQCIEVESQAAEVGRALATAKRELDDRKEAASMQHETSQLQRERARLEHVIEEHEMEAASSAAELAGLERQLAGLNGSISTLETQLREHLRRKQPPQAGTGAVGSSGTQGSRRGGGRPIASSSYGGGRVTARAPGRPLRQRFSPSTTTSASTNARRSLVVPPIGRPVAITRVSPTSSRRTPPAAARPHQAPALSNKPHRDFYADHAYDVEMGYDLDLDDEEFEF